MIGFNPDDIYLVTGASSGLGAATALRLNELGATVLAVGRDEGRLLKTKCAALAPDRLQVVVNDIAEDVEALPEFVKALAAQYGKLRGMVHSAGVVDLTPLRGIVIEKARSIFEVNYFAGLMLAKGLARKNLNVGRGVSMVFVSSLGSISGYAGQIVYSSTKGAVNSMVKSMAVELAPQGIRVNAILPGHVVTRGTSEYDDLYSEEYKRELATMYPLGHGAPSDVADLTAFLLSDRSRWITGQGIVIDGGRCLL